ncbi:hypothetical protein [uncultured Microscilla sp.]|uniref:hypothetical protein n=1 Tax=uncultured Microscilla sp. TaxID=432653 RepID=UPI002633A17C|nr:hypothetical protein [uncultured Microscilla sp.]
MVIDKKNKAIGEWYLEGSDTFLNVDISLYESMLSKLVSILNIFYNEKLLYLDHLVLHDWVKNTQQETLPTSSTQERVVIDVKKLPFDQVKSTFLDTLKIECQKTQAYPMMIDCFGDGLIEDITKPYFAKNLIWISIDIIMGYVFTIRTQSDVSGLSHHFHEILFFQIKK